MKVYSQWKTYKLAHENNNNYQKNDHELDDKYKNLKIF